MKSVVRSIKERGGRPTGQGEAQEGPPSAQAHLDLLSPPSPAPAPSPPPSCSTGQGSETPGPWPSRASALAQAPTLPSQHSPGHGRLVAPGTAQLGKGAGFPHSSCSYHLLSISQKIGPGIPQTHFWGPEMGSEPPSFRPAPVRMVCLSSDPENLTLKTPESHPGRGFHPVQAARGVSRSPLATPCLRPAS